MKLRQKKNHNLSQDAFYSEFQKQHCQTYNRKLDSKRKQFYDQSKHLNVQIPNTNYYAQMLTKFINNSNIAKKRRQKKRQIKPLNSDIDISQSYGTKRVKKIQDNNQFNEIKKIQYRRSMNTNPENIKKKTKLQEKRELSLNSFSINKVAESQSDTLNLRKQFSEQNIINNGFIGNTLNIADYCNMIQAPYLGFNPSFLSAWFQINPLFKPNLQNMGFSAEQMRSGLYRQFQIYEKFKQKRNVDDIQKKPLAFSSQNKSQTVQSQKKPVNIQILGKQSKVNPDKIFKRASYHVGIAYSIYMDNIQKEGRMIKNFSEIDPTGFARKYKSGLKKY